MGKSASTPPTPDYTGAAQATATGNMISQVTPYGNLTYKQTGSDSKGNPMFTATTSLSPEQQQLLNQQTQTSLGLGKLQQQGLGYVQGMINQPFDTSKLPTLQSSLNPAQYTQATANPSMQTSLDNQGMAGWDKATNLMMQRIQPQMAMQEKQFDAEMANQGIVPGTEAYTNARRNFDQQQNDLINQATLAGQQVQQNMFGQALSAGQFGNTAQQQMYANAMQNLGVNNALAQQQFQNQLSSADLANQARQQGFNELAYQRNEPINTLNAVRSGSQVTNPSFTTTPAGPDYMGATQATYNSQLANANAQNAANNAFTSGLFSLGGAALMRSDIRTKEHIKAIGWLPNGLPVYEYEYKPEFKNDALAGHGKFIGVMAQDVEKVKPEAVFEVDGYKVVDYGALNA